MKPVPSPFMEEPVIFERSVKGRSGFSLPDLDVPEVDPEQLFHEDLLRREAPLLPEVSELEVVRHFTRLSQWNYSIDGGFYPLGSCTMKYNPKVNEVVAALHGFSRIHPFQPLETVQGALRLMYELQQFLAEISGMDAVTLQPAAGAHGEWTGISMIRSFHTKNGDPRQKVLIPQSAHGTNPASSALCNYEVVPVESGPEGVILPEAVASKMDDQVAALMITNPNTLGIFERNIQQICEIVHSKGGLVYYDGANLNAVLGQTRMREMGVDVMHFNLHKTFTTPHGGGGPGAGPVGVRKTLEPFLPVPVIRKTDEGYSFDWNRPDSIGKVRSFYGNFAVLVRAYTYIREMGASGLKAVSERAVLNANYVKNRLSGYFNLPYQQPCMHEVVFTDKKQQAFGIKTVDLAKRLIDYGFHPPTVYFPLVVSGALMIEPTETESLQTIDQFCEAMISIAEEVEKNDSSIFSEAPRRTPVRRLNETEAVKNLKLTWKPLAHSTT